MIEISPVELYNFFESRGYDYFYHANTVRTACTLIMQKGLLSRGEIRERGLQMTSQSSDDIDKHFGVWNDIFFDIVDLHGYFPRQNLYGPVCFKLKKEFLLSENLPNICITKDNPIYWKDEFTEEDKYYSSASEYISEFDENMENSTIHSKMFTIHDTNKKIPFNRYLDSIILDNPRVSLNGNSLFEQAEQAIIDSLEQANLSIDLLKIRRCSNCFCVDNYLKQVSVEELKKFFIP